MRHVSDGALRQLVDDPLAVPDAARHHLGQCDRCQSRSAQIGRDAARAFELVSAPQLSSDSGLAWTQFRHRLAHQAQRQGPALRVPRRPAGRLVGASVSAGGAVTLGVLAAGVAAAATLTTVFAPTRVAPVPVNGGDLRAIASLMGIGSTRALGGFTTPAGSRQLPFGTLRWTSAGRAQAVPSIARVRARTGLAAVLPATLPAGVGSPDGFVVQPKVTATMTFGRIAGRALAGSSLIVTGGPAALVMYGSPAGSAGLRTLGIMSMERPVASSTGATASQLENFILSQPGIPPDLAQEIRILGSARTVLPVPTPPGAKTAPVQVGSARGVLISDPSGAASGVIWEGRDGVVHIVAGLLDRKDILDVARQVG
jgi:hypothetical protein